MIRAVLFDLDATLIDDGLNWRRSVTQTLEQVCARHRHVDLQDLLAAYYTVAGEVWDTVKDAPAAPWGNMDAVDRAAGLGRGPPPTAHLRKVHVTGGCRRLSPAQKPRGQTI